MRNKCVQMSLYDTYKCVAASMEDDKPKLFRQLDEHIDWDSLIPARFYLAFYRNIGRPRKYPLVAFLKSLVLQKIFGYVNDSVLLVTLRHSREMRNFCGFEKVPDAAKLTRFKQDFLPYIMEVFERLVELTEPICREMDAELAGSLIYDTTGIESYVAENNPKFFSAKLRQAKLMTKTNPDTACAVISALPSASAVICPSPSTCTTSGLLDIQITSWEEELSEYRTVALRLVVSPVLRVILFWLSDTLVIVVRNSL